MKLSANEITKNIYALFIGINNYPNPRHRLKGCLEDAKQMYLFLEASCKKQNISFHSKILNDNNASRNGIIKGFDHFSNAKDDDICFFFFAGHGSRVIAPRELLHLESDGYIESLVCHDSRENGGKDLMNKELSWLIWKVTKDKPNLQFISIMDCCHSGKVTRTGHIDQKEILIRTVEPIEKNFKANTLLGFSDFDAIENGRYNPPIGRQVLLAASKDKETAKEIYTKNGKRGIFTYCLLELLEETDRLTYSELINRVNVRVKNVVKKQSPQVSSTLPNDKRQYFLTKEYKSLQMTYVVSWNKTKRHWRINAGHMQGVLISNKHDLPQFKLLKETEQVKTLQVFSNYTIIQSLRLNKQKSYLAQQILPSLMLIEADNSDTRIIQYIKTASQGRDNFPFKWTTKRKSANFEILAKEDALSFRSINFSEGKIFETIFPTFYKTDEENILLFLDTIEKYYKWNSLLRLKNPDTRISTKQFEVNVYKSSQDKQIDNTIFEKVDTNEPIELFFDKKNILNSSQFRLNVKNIGLEKLWISACYFDADYSIQNHLLDIQELEKGEEVWAIAVGKDGKRTQNIPIAIPRQLFSDKPQVINAYLKLFISTDEFSTDNINQQGIDKKAKIKRSHKIKSITHCDWRTKEIFLSIKNH